MKKVVTLVFVFAGFNGLAQQHTDNDKKAIQDKINLFFKVLETKDTVLYNTIAFTNGQIWTVRRVQDTLKHSTRTIREDMNRLVVMKGVIEERPLSYEIKIHNDIAVAWVPYTLSVSGKFSHCGIDVFTLLRTAVGWKIVNASYSVEPNGCGAFKKNKNETNK